VPNLSFRDAWVVARGQGASVQNAKIGLASSGKLRPASAGRGELNGRPAGRPYNEINLLVREERLARPVQEMIPALWFLRLTALLPGRAMPEIQ